MLKLSKAIIDLILRQIPFLHVFRAKHCLKSGRRRIGALHILLIVDIIVLLVGWGPEILDCFLTLCWRVSHIDPVSGHEIAFTHLVLRLFTASFQVYDRLRLIVGG